MYYSIENQRGERRSPYTMCQNVLVHWFNNMVTYFDGEEFEIVASEEADNWPQIGDSGQYVD